MRRGRPGTSTAALLRAAAWVTALAPPACFRWSSEVATDPRARRAYFPGGRDRLRGRFHRGTGLGEIDLASALSTEVRRRLDFPVAVLTVDPSSPVTGGAILGDRVRMQRHALDDDVFIRSMATRGHFGGLAAAVPEAVRLLDATGWPLVIVETVGVGQVEVEAAATCDTVVVVVVPGWGDAVQANKAGLLEIADVLVINKADRPGVEETARDLSLMLQLSGTLEWTPPIVKFWRQAERASPNSGMRSLAPAIPRAGRSARGLGAPSGPGTRRSGSRRATSRALSCDRRQRLQRRPVDSAERSSWTPPRLPFGSSNRSHGNHRERMPPLVEAVPSVADRAGGPGIAARGEALRG